MIIKKIIYIWTAVTGISSPSLSKRCFGSTCLQNQFV